MIKYCETLKRITGRARKCGPTALSAITGLPSHLCATIMRSITKERAIRGVHAVTLVKALTLLNYTASLIRYDHSLDRPTLRNWIRDRDEGKLYIINIKRHWIAYSNHQICDNGFLFSKSPASSQGLTHMRCKVRQVITIEPPCATKNPFPDECYH